MANRNFNRAQNLEKEVKSLFVDIAIGATGAPTLTRGRGIASVSRTSAGLYKITLDDKYNRLMHVDIKQVVATAEDLTFQVKAEDVDGDKTIDIQCLAAAVATDPSDGSRLLIRIDLKNTSI